MYSSGRGVPSSGSSGGRFLCILAVVTALNIVITLYAVSEIGSIGSKQEKFRTSLFWKLEQLQNSCSKDDTLFSLISDKFMEEAYNREKETKDLFSLLQRRQQDLISAQQRIADELAINIEGVAKVDGQSIIQLFSDLKRDVQLLSSTVSDQQYSLEQLNFDVNNLQLSVIHETDRIYEVIIGMDSILEKEMEQDSKLESISLYQQIEHIGPTPSSYLSNTITSNPQIGVDENYTPPPQEDIEYFFSEIWQLHHKTVDDKYMRLTDQELLYEHRMFLPLPSLDVSTLFSDDGDETTLMIIVEMPDTGTNIFRTLLSSESLTEMKRPSCTASSDYYSTSQLELVGCLGNVLDSYHGSLDELMESFIPFDSLHDSQKSSMMLEFQSGVGHPIALYESPPHTSLFTLERAVEALIQSNFPEVYTDVNYASNYFEITVLRDPLEYLYTSFGKRDKTRLYSAEEEIEVLGVSTISHQVITLDWSFEQRTGISIEDIGFQEYLTEAFWRWNYFTRIFAGHHTSTTFLRFPSDEPITRETSQAINDEGLSSSLLRSAIRKIGSFPFFGLYERMEESIELFEFTFCMSLDVSAVRFPPPPPYVRDSLSSGELQTFHSHNRLDTLLYDYARDIFNLRLERMKKAKKEGYLCRLNESPCGLRCTDYTL